MGIMSLLLVFCGLVVGLLGRGWAGAWFLVLLGIVFGFPPCLSFLMNSGDDAGEEPASEKRVLLSDEPEPVQTGGKSYRMGRSEDQAELDRQARQFEAMLEKQRLKKEREDEARRRAAQKEKEEREAAVKRERERQEAEKKRREEKQKAETEKRERRRRAEEERRREQEKRRKGATSGNVYKAPVVNGDGEFFTGVSGREELKKRYKELIKQYHPDNGAGDVEALQRVQREYEELSLFFEKYEKHNF